MSENENVTGLGSRSDALFPFNNIAEGRDFFEDYRDDFLADTPFNHDHERWNDDTLSALAYNNAPEEPLHLQPNRVGRPVDAPSSYYGSESRDGVPGTSSSTPQGDDAPAKSSVPSTIRRRRSTSNFALRMQKLVDELVVEASDPSGPLAKLFGIADGSVAPCLLVQTWERAHDNKGRNVLTTGKSKYGLLPKSEEKKGARGFGAFRHASKHYYFHIDKEAGHLDLPGRVWSKGCFEYSPNAQFYGRSEYARHWLATKIDLKSSIAAPLIYYDKKKGGPVVVAVLEIVSTRQFVDCRPILLILDRLLEEKGFSSNFSSFGASLLPSVKVGASDTSEKLHALVSDICIQYNLPVGNVWASTRSSLSPILITKFATDSSLDEFVDMCTLQSYLGSQIGAAAGGPVISTLTNGGTPEWWPSVMSESMESYLLSHHARIFGLSGIVALGIASREETNFIFIVEFVLPVEVKDLETQRPLALGVVEATWKNVSLPGCVLFPVTGEGMGTTLTIRKESTVSSTPIFFKGMEENLLENANDATEIKSKMDTLQLDHQTQETTKLHSLKKDTTGHPGEANLTSILLADGKTELEESLLPVAYTNPIYIAPMLSPGYKIEDNTKDNSIQFSINTATKCEADEVILAAKSTGFVVIHETSCMVGRNWCVMVAFGEMPAWEQDSLRNRGVDHLNDNHTWNYPLSCEVELAFKMIKNGRNNVSQWNKRARKKSNTLVS